MIRNKRGFTQPLRARAGFTLLELLIAIVIIAVLVGLAVPVYNAQVEKARAAEALQMLGAIRRSMVRYYVSHGYSYAGAVIRGYQSGSTPGDIDLDPNNIGGGQKMHFTYGINSISPSSYTARTGPAPGGPVGPPSGPDDNWIEINENGTITRSGIYE